MDDFVHVEFINYDTVNYVQDKNNDQMKKVFTRTRKNFLII